MHGKTPRASPPPADELFNSVHLWRRNRDGNEESTGRICDEARRITVCLVAICLEQLSRRQNRKGKLRSPSSHNTLRSLAPTSRRYGHDADFEKRHEAKLEELREAVSAKADAKRSASALASDLSWSSVFGLSINESVPRPR